MFDKNYYNQKSEKIIKRFSLNKDITLKKLSDTLNEYWSAQRDLQQDLLDIKKLEEGSKKNKKNAKSKVQNNNK